MLKQSRCRKNDINTFRLCLALAVGDFGHRCTPLQPFTPATFRSTRKLAPRYDRSSLFRALLGIRGLRGTYADNSLRALQWRYPLLRTLVHRKYAQSQARLNYLQPVCTRTAQIIARFALGSSSTRTESYNISVMHVKAKRSDANHSPRPQARCLASVRSSPKFHSITCLHAQTALKHPSATIATRTSSIHHCNCISF